MTGVPSSERTGPRSRALQAGLGAAVTLVGLLLTLSPFASLAVLLVVVAVGAAGIGIGRILEDRRSWRGWVPGAAYLATALVVLAWPGPSIGVLARVVGVALVVDGVLEVSAGRAARGSDRWGPVLSGAATVVFGAVALGWPDVTVLVVAVVFGLRVLVLGLRAVVAGVRGRPPRVRTAGGRGAGGRRVLGGAALLAVALAVGGLSVALHAGDSRPDAFYTPPGDVPGVPGRLVRAEPFMSQEVPATARAWRILYTTTGVGDAPAVASGLVLAPVASVGADGTPADVVAWAHGTTGAAPGCAPSVLHDGLAAGAMFVQDDVVAHGWAMVATDYLGLGTSGPHPYLVGDLSARSVLDAVRAARELGDVELSERTVVWGHSQGGGAALWTGQIAPSYAPDVPLDGVAALAPASDPPALLRSLPHVTGGNLFASYVVEGYTGSYPELTYASSVRPAVRTVVREMAQRCLADRSILVSALQAVFVREPIWKDDNAALHARLEQNVPSGPIAAPVLLQQGEADPLVTPSRQDDYVAARCAARHAVDYRTYAGLGHVALVERGSPAVADLLTWTSSRFAGDPPRDACPAATDG